MKIKKTTPIILIVFLFSCKLSNIYTESQNNNNNNKDVNTLIQRITNTYGGLQNWKDVKTVSVILTDNWPSFHWRLLANPWREETTSFKFDWKPNSNNSRIEILTGKNKSKKYGIQNWSTYSVKDSVIVLKKHKKIKFHLPTMEYFFEFPFRIQEANKLKYGGSKEVNGILYKTILMSWNTFEPQKKVDQYLIYINPKTFLIDYLEFTVRDQGKFTYATVHFEDFKKVKAFTFPHKITAYFQNKVPGKTIGHQITVDTLLLNKQFPNNYFIPDSSARGNK